MSQIKIKLLESFADVHGYVTYKLLHQRYVWDLPRSIKIEVNYDKKTKTFLANAPDYNGLFTVTRSEDELEDSINDAIYTYFNVPRFVAKSLPNLFHSERDGKIVDFVSTSMVVMA